MTETGEVVAAADAMRQKHAELMDRPLNEIYVQLARSALEAAERFRDAERRANCRHTNSRGTGYINSDGSSRYDYWYCPECGESRRTVTRARQGDKQRVYVLKNLRNR